MEMGGENNNNLLQDDETAIYSCSEYIYLGTKISYNGRIEAEIEEKFINGEKKIGNLVIFVGEKPHRSRKRPNYIILFLKAW